MADKKGHRMDGSLWLRAQTLCRNSTPYLCMTLGNLRSLLCPSFLVCKMGMILWISYYFSIFNFFRARSAHVCEVLNVSVCHVINVPKSRYRRWRDWQADTEQRGKRSLGWKVSHHNSLPASHSAEQVCKSTPDCSLHLPSLWVSWSGSILLSVLPEKETSSLWTATYPHDPLITQPIDLGLQRQPRRIL